MEPLNKQERTEAFVKVLVLFLFAVVMIAIPMYYAFMLPCKEKNLTWEEYELLKKQMSEMKHYDHQFLVKTDSAKLICNKYEQEENKVARDKRRFQYSAISLDMEKLSNTISNDTLKSRLYANAVYSFDKLFNNQETIFTLQDSIKAILNPVPGPTPPGPAPIPETVATRFRKIVEEALQKNDNNRRLSGQSIGLSEKTFSAIVKDLKIKNQ
jgi:hypothetical protein